MRLHQLRVCTDVIVAAVTACWFSLGVCVPCAGAQEQQQPASPSAAPSAQSAGVGGAGAPEGLSAGELEAAINAFDDENYSKAVSVIESYGPKAAVDAEAQFYLGYSLLRLERPQAALAAIETALRLRANDPRAIYLRGVLTYQLKQPGAEGDFALVLRTLPDSPIGRSSAEYLRDIAAQRDVTLPSLSLGTTAVTNQGQSQQAASAADAQADAQAAAQSAAHGATSASPPAGDPQGLSSVDGSWRFNFALRMALDYDTNPAFRPGSEGGSADEAGGGRGGRGDLQLLSNASGSAALSLSARASLERDVGSTLKLSAALSAFQRMYAPPRADAQRTPLHEQPPARPEANVFVYPHDYAPGSSHTARNVGDWQANNLSDFAVDLAADARSGALAARLAYTGAITLYGFEPFAHEHGLALQLSWPSDSWLSGSLRVTGYALRPIDIVYDHLTGLGATVRPGVSALLLGDDLLVEGGLCLEGFDAADYHDHELMRFYSYSFVGYGPELYVSYLAPHEIHLTAWGSVVNKGYMDEDRDPYTNEGRPILRRDLRWSAGARAAIAVRTNLDAFVETSYLDNRSNLDARQHDDRNAKRLMISVGAFWM